MDIAIYFDIEQNCIKSKELDNSFCAIPYYDKLDYLIKKTNTGNYLIYGPLYSTKSYNISDIEDLPQNINYELTTLNAKNYVINYIKLLSIDNNILKIIIANIYEDEDIVLLDKICNDLFKDKVDKLYDLPEFDPEVSKLINVLYEKINYMWIDNKKRYLENWETIMLSDEIVNKLPIEIWNCHIKPKLLSMSST